MKYIKLFEKYNDIEYKLKLYSINYATVKDDGKIDVHGDVSLFYKKLDEIPLDFGNVRGNFTCASNNLKSLKGCPENVDGSFSCGNNKITNLEYFPKNIGENIVIDNNNVKSLVGIQNVINGFLLATRNKINTLDGFPSKVIGGIYLEYNKITTLNGLSSDISSEVHLKYNPLPKEIKSNLKYINDILKLQYDYKIWNKDNTLNIRRFGILMDEIKDQ